MIECHPPQQKEGEVVDVELQVFYEVPHQVFINPKITHASDKKVSFWHGCLSALERPMGKVATYKHIDIEAYDGKGNKIKKHLHGLAAIIFQHEFKHLLGSLYSDYAVETLPVEELRQAFAEGKLQRY